MTTHIYSIVYAKLAAQFMVLRTTSVFCHRILAEVHVLYAIGTDGAEHIVVQAAVVLDLDYASGVVRFALVLRSWRLRPAYRNSWLDRSCSNLEDTHC
jgi:hypothetical protein